MILRVSWALRTTVIVKAQYVTIQQRHSNSLEEAVVGIMKRMVGTVRTATYDTTVWNSGTHPGSQWFGSLIGVADYPNNPHSRPIVVKLESGTSNDLFVGFNRAIGVNRDVLDARDQVTVIQAGGDGLVFSQSYVKAVLSQGDSYSVSNWHGSGLDMTIHVNEINLESNPGYAYVTMSLDNTEIPTYSPTSALTYKVR